MTMVQVAAMMELTKIMSKDLSYTIHFVAVTGEQGLYGSDI
jgi:hypothetical protein